MIFFNFFDGLGSAFFSGGVPVGRRVEAFTSRSTCRSSADVSCPEGVALGMLCCSKDRLLFVGIFKFELAWVAETPAVISPSINLVVGENNCSSALCFPSRTGGARRLARVSIPLSLSTASNI